MAEAAVFRGCPEECWYYKDKNERHMQAWARVAKEKEMPYLSLKKTNFSSSSFFVVAFALFVTRVEETTTLDT